MTSLWYRYLTARSHLDAELRCGTITADQHRDAHRQLRAKYGSDVQLTWSATRRPAATRP